MKNRNRVLALLLITVMAVGMMTACGSTKKEPADTSTNAEKADDTGKEDKGGKGSTKDTPLVVGYSTFNQKFSPFFADVQYDLDVAEMTQALLVSPDRSGAIVYNGIEGETIPYNGTDYTYTGIADVTVEQNEEDNTTTYDFKLRDDITFSDGEPLTADDVIFNIYVYCDPSYDGSVTLFSQPIKGLKNYRSNSTAAEDVSAEDIKKAVKDMPEELSEQIRKNIIEPTLTSESNWALDNWKDYEKSLEVKSAEEFYAKVYSKEESYSAKGKDMDTIVKDMIEMYGNDYQSLGTAYGGDEAYFDGDVNSLAEAYVVEQNKKAGEGKDVPNIEGVKKINDYEVQVITDGYDATTIYQFSWGVAPMHYYGDKDAYDYENNKFGFTRGDLSAVKEKTTKPMGAGPYKFMKYENKVVYLEANELFFKGAPKTKYIQLKETLDSDKIAAVEQGTVDITDPVGSKDGFEQIKKINSNGELDGDQVTVQTADNLGYGYVGINAGTVNVGGDPGSDESKALRKALATVIAVYRDVNIDSFYGDAASVINYPISNTSWAAPQKSDSDYQIAYSRDKDGNPIYTDDMSAEDKYAAAKKAALGLLEEAGYTVSGGKVTKAPEGAKMQYELIIPADGNTDHPSFGLVTDVEAAMKEIGITIDINNPADSNELWDKTDAGTQELWCAAWTATPDPDMYQIYYSKNVIGGGGTNSNHYYVQDKDLDELILDARSSADQTYRKSVYKQCLDIILDWGVEIPVYQRQNCYLFSKERVNIDSLAKDITPHYYWIKEAYNVELN